MRIIRFLFIVILLIGLPLLGVVLAGHSIDPYLEFPPTPVPFEPLPFSWPLFGMLGVVIVAVISPFIFRFLTFPSPSYQPPFPTRRFPWWGWAGLSLTMLAWILAWNRYTWFEPLQIHTFPPLWLGYILVINALALKRTSHCLMVDRPWVFLSLFPPSAGFWWFFEFLNRFVHNWHYVGPPEVDGFKYFWLASLSFSTVLPAVYGTYEWLTSFPQLSAPLQNWWKVPIPHGAVSGWTLLLPASVALMGIGLWPEILYPLLWIAPLLVLLGLQGIFGEASVLAPLTDGDWRPVALPAMAALICGFFWEMWNSQSLVHWEYAIPYFHGFQLFEMPLLGYAGYLPFGLECMAFIQLVLPHQLKIYGWPSGQPESPHRHDQRSRSPFLDKPHTVM